MWDSVIQQASIKWQVPEVWIRAVIDTESSWDPNAYRAEPQINDASYGLMQLLVRTARGLGFAGDAEDLYDPAINIDLGTKLLGDLRSRYGDDFRRIYSAYNSGKPDLYRTSSGVGKNVSRAVHALERYLTEAVTAVTASPTTSGVGLLLFGVLLWVWAKRK